MDERYITPPERNRRIIDAVRLALVAYITHDYGQHLQAMDRLMDLGERELAQAFTQRWNIAERMDKEYADTKESAYREAIGV